MTNIVRFSFPTTIHFGAGARKLLSAHLVGEGVERRTAANANHRVGTMVAICLRAAHGVRTHRVAAKVGKDANGKPRQFGQQLREQR